MSRAATRSGEPIDGPVAANPISAAAGTAWLYVPRAQILVPTGGAPPPPGTSYYLNEDGLGRFASEDGVYLFTQE